MGQSRRVMPFASAALGAAVFSAMGFVLGSAIVDRRHDAERREMIRENYTDRAQICLEAAALLRNRETDRAIAYLEAKTLVAVRGVPMGRSYSELPEKSQVLLVGAERSRSAYPGVDFDIQQLTHGVPRDHSRLSEDLNRLGRHR